MPESAHRKHHVPGAASRGHAVEVLADALFELLLRQAMPVPKRHRKTRSPGQSTSSPLSGGKPLISGTQPAPVLTESEAASLGAGGPAQHEEAEK